MAKQEIYSWSKFNSLGCLPYSESVVYMWILSETQILCYRLIHSAYSSDREYSIIYPKENRHRYIRREEFEALVPPNLQQVMFYSYAYMMPGGKIAHTFFKDKGDKEGFLICPENTLTKLDILFNHYKKMSIQELYHKYFEQ